MRGRSIIKVLLTLHLLFQHTDYLQETTSPSLCAFCAHRLGQARRPSHVQRRFLQSSRPVSKPPAEGAAVREETANRIPQPTWGRPGGSAVPAASWGRPAFGNGGGVPPGARGPAAASVGSNGNSADPAQKGAPKAAATSDLLPHEQVAREQMLAKYALQQQRPVTQVHGTSPEFTRGGRLVPRTEKERIVAAQREVAKRKARDRHDENRGSLADGSSRSAGPRIRHVLGDAEHTPQDMDRDDSRWGQLERQRDGQRQAAEERRRPKNYRFAEGRAQREEESKMGRYTPLGPRTNAQPYESTDRSRRSFGQRPPQQTEREAPPLIRRMQSVVAEPSPNGIKTPEPTAEPTKTAEPIRSSRYDSSIYEGMLPAAEPGQTPANFRPISATSGEGDFENPNLNPNLQDQRHQQLREEEEHIERSEKKRKARGRKEPEPASSYEMAPRGKGRDKAKRREEFYNEDDQAGMDEAIAAAEERKEQRRLERAAKKAAKAAAPTPMLLPEYISVSNLAVALKVRFEDFVEKMEELGFEETGHDHILNSENAGLIAQEYNFEAIIDRGESEDLRARDPATNPSSLPQRPPVVTIMGHVDHGKTTLLDWLRKSSVAATEHGGITQHIGAFSVPMPSGKLITFLDTPGHAAFLSMRQRGANVTDIVILVVAADDSVKPQTIEAINHAKAAKVPIIVAINKVDKEDSNIDRVKQDLARHGVDVEDFGGETQVVCVSGKTGQGMGELEEAAVTLSEILDMRAETDGQAEGWVLEASIKSMGKVATVLVRRGTMRPGDFIVAGKTWARIRCLRNEAGVEVAFAGPGTPVEIDGWREQPLAGDEVLQAPDEGKAKSVVDYRLEKDERDKMAQDMEAINENRKAEQDKRDREKADALAAAEALAADEEAPEVSRDIKPTGPREVYFIIKGDVSGSVEAVIDSIAALGTKEVQPHILRSGVGQLSEFDIEHAAAAKGHLLNFNTPVEPNISRLAEEAKVRIIDHNIIYRLVDDVKAELSKHLPPLVTQRVLGEAEIAQVFEITVKGRQHKSIAGCKVRNGTINRTAKIRVMRAGKKVFDGLFPSPIYPSHFSFPFALSLPSSLLPPYSSEWKNLLTQTRIPRLPKERQERRPREQERQ